MTPAEREAVIVADLARVIEPLSDIYTEEGVRIWMYSSNSLLDGERPVDVVRSGEVDRVLQVIGSINAGGL